jgi:hypothetical protein
MHTRTYALAYVRTYITPASRDRDIRPPYGNKDNAVHMQVAKTMHVRAYHPPAYIREYVRVYVRI